MSEKRMQRADMWEYFRNRQVPADKIGRGNSDRDKALKHIKYECIINGDRLIIGQWRSLGQIESKTSKKGNTRYYRSRDADFIGVYYITPSGERHTTTDGKDWIIGKVEYLPLGGYSYYTSWNTYGYKFECLSGHDEAIEWIDKYWGDCSWFYNYKDDVIDVLDHVEQHISFQRRLNADQRRRKKWSDYVNGFPALPDDFEAWARETAFGGLEYAFGEKDSDVYFCTACGKTHKQKKWKHRGRYECSRTGKRIKCEKVEKDHIWRRERLMIVQSHKTICGEICSVVRHFTADMTWSRTGSVFKLYPDCVLILRFDGSLVCGDDIIYNVGRADEFDVRNPCAYQHSKCYCYPDVSALDGTAYSGIGINVAAARGWRLNYNNLMGGWHDDPRMEYLIKGNFKQLVYDITSGCGHVVGLREGNTAQEVLGIDGQAVARLRQADGGAYYLDWLRNMFMSYGIKRDDKGIKIVHGKISEEAISFFCDKKITPYNVAFALNIGMSPEQIANYLKKKHGYKRSDVSYLPSVYHVVIQQWKDYLQMAEKLKLDTRKESVYKPKVLKDRHDELVEILNREKSRLEAERIESEYPAIKPVCEKIKELYEWGDGVYEVIVPEGAAEIQREGRLLHHCVGTTDRYFDRIAEEESYIMFLRKTERRTAPWYTMEVEPGGAVRQLRTFGDDEGKDRDEAKAFLKKWRAEIAKRIGQDEREAAEISREKRLREFEELRRNGNIIRNGKLAGKLLVEVLEADFKEYNDDVAV